MVGVPGAMLTVGLGTTLAVALPVWLLQPALFPITLYRVVTLGLAITTALFVELKAVAGDQEYVFAPEANKLALKPAHILADVTVIVGLGITVTLYTALLVHVPAMPSTDMVAMV